MTREHDTKSGVSKRLVRRLQKVTGMKYTACLRVLEELPEAGREAYVRIAESFFEEEPQA